MIDQVKASEIAKEFATQQGIRWISVNSVERMTKFDEENNYEWVVRLETARPSEAEGALELAIIIIDEATETPSVLETL